MSQDCFAGVKQIYEAFSEEYYSGKFASVHSALDRIGVEESVPHSMRRFVILYTPPTPKPRLLLIGHNPSFFHKNLTDLADAKSGLTITEKNLNDVAERIPDESSYLRHSHKFASDLGRIFEDICQPHWLKEMVGMNSLFVQTGGKGVERLKDLSDKDEFKELEMLCVSLSKRLIELMKPKLVLFVGAKARDKFSVQQFPRNFNPTGTSFMDVTHPANQKGGWTVTSEDIKIWFDKFKDAYEHIN
jgi:hypothetical protein